MAKKPARTQETDTVERGQIEDLENILDAETLNPALQSLYSELGMEGNIEAVVHVTLIEDTGKEARVWKGAPADYDLETIAKKFGSGDYRVKVAVRNETGQMPVRGNRVITMKLSADEDAKLKLLRENPQALQAPQAPHITVDMIAAAVRAAMPPPVAQPAIDFPAMLKTMAETFRAVMPAQQAPAPPQGLNPLEVLKVMREFIPRERDIDDEAPRRGGSNQFDVFGKLIDKFAPMFQNALADQPGAVPNANPALPPPAGTPPPPIEGQPMPPIPDTIPPALRMGVAFLVSQASGGHDPATYADVVLDQMPEDEAQRLIAMRDPIAFLVGVNPAVETHRQWFTDLIQAIRESFEDEPGLETPGDEQEQLPQV